MSAAAATADPTEVQAQQQEWPSTPHADAERMVEKAQSRNMTVKFMLDKLKEVHNMHLSQFAAAQYGLISGRDPPNRIFSITATKLVVIAGGMWGGPRLLPGRAL
jgi:hypothetical protein